MQILTIIALVLLVVVTIVFSVLLHKCLIRIDELEDESKLNKALVLDATARSMANFTVMAQLQHAHDVLDGEFRDFCSKSHPEQQKQVSERRALYKELRAVHYRTKKKGWFTPKYTAFEQEYNPVVCFVLREKTDNFKYIRATNRQIYEVSFADSNEFDGLNIEEAFSRPIYVNKGSVMHLTNTKLGIRLVSNDTGLPITDWLPFCVRYNKYRTPNGGEEEFVGLSRLV